MDQRTSIRVMGNADIELLDKFDQEEFKKLLEQKKGQLRVDESVLGIQLNQGEIENILVGKMSMNCMAFFLAYLYNFDLLRKEPMLPYFILSELESANSMVLSDFQEALRLRRRKQDHKLLLIVMSVQGKWVVSTFDIDQMKLVLVDLQQNKKIQKDKLKEYTLKTVTLTNAIKKYNVKTESTLFATDSDGSSDGGDLCIYFLYQLLQGIIIKTLFLFFKGQNITVNTFKTAQKRQIRDKMVWAILKMIPEQPRIELLPKLPAFEQFTETEFKQLDQKFQSKLKTQKDLDQILVDEEHAGIGWTYQEVKSFGETGKCSPRMMSFWLLYVATPYLPYFMISQQEELLEDFNQQFKVARRPVDHTKLFMVSQVQVRWIFSLFLLGQQTLQIVDLQSSKSLKNDEMRKLMDAFFAQSKANKKYIVNKCTFITQSNTDNTDGSELVVHFLYNHIGGISLDKIRFTYTERKFLRQKMLWVLYKLCEPQLNESKQNPQQKISSMKVLTPKVDTPKVVDTPKNEEKKRPALRTPSGQQAQTAPRIQLQSSIFRKKPAEEEEKKQQPKTSNVLQTVKSNSEVQSYISPKDEQSASRMNSQTSIMLANPKSTRNSTKPPAQSIYELVDDDDDDDEDFEQLYKKKSSLKNQTPLTPRKEVVQEYPEDLLERVKNDLENYYNDISKEPQQSVQDSLKLNDIDRINQRIQALIQKRQHISIDEFLDERNLPHNNNKSINDTQTYHNYSTVIQDDFTIRQMLSDMLDYDDYSDNLNQSLLKRKNYINSKLKISNKQKRANDSIAGFFKSIDTPNPYEKPIQPHMPILPSLLSLDKTELFQNTKLAAHRYGIQLDIPTMQSFMKDSKMPPILFDFLLRYTQEKSDHQKLYGFGYAYACRVKIVPLKFYNILTYNNIHSTYRINYLEASKYTFDNTGKGMTLFDTFDWLIVPINELPNEYSIVVVNMKNRNAYCFILSSLATRVRDPLYINPERNPYLKNVISFLQREFEIKQHTSRDYMGKHVALFGQANDNPNFGLSINYTYSGLYAIYIIIHLIKHGDVENIKVDESQILIMKKILHDLVVKIGYNPDHNIFHLLQDIQWPF